jgi:hypothetical protein
MFIDEYELRNCSLCNFLHVPATFSLLGQNILLSTLFSNTLVLCSPLRARDEVIHPYKTTVKIIGLYILIFKSIAKKNRKIKDLN